MRSTAPIPGNPWPHEMVIKVDDSPHQLVELLWIREAWELDVVAVDAPPPLEDRPTPPTPVQRTAVDADGTRAEWSRLWPSIWSGAIDHAGGINDARDIALLQQTDDGSPERSAMLRRLIGPTWRDEVGDAALDDRIHAWNERAFAKRTASRPNTLGEQPEQRNLDQLIPAWRAGLEKIVTLPCVGDHTRQIGEHVLLVTDATRDDPERYARALREFAAGTAIGQGSPR